jgi:hypothetical protein
MVERIFSQLIQFVAPRLLPPGEEWGRALREFVVRRRDDFALPAVSDYFVLVKREREREGDRERGRKKVRERERGRERERERERLKLP